MASEATQRRLAAILSADILAMAYHQKGMEDAGLEAALRHLPAEFEAPLRAGFGERGWSGWHLAVTDVLAKMEIPCGGSHPVEGARAYARAGQADAMYRCLDEEIAVFGDWRLGLKVDPDWDAYLTDPRFAALLRRVNLAD